MNNTKKGLIISGELLARNAILNFIGQATPLLIGIVTIPFIIHGLGVERFGILSLAWVVIGYFSFFDLGLGRATTKFVAEALGKEETVRLPYLVWTSLVVHLLLGLIGGLLLAFLAPILVEKVFNITPALIGETRNTFLILAISVPIILASTVLRGVLEAGQRFDLVNAVNIPSSSLTYLLPAIGLLMGIGLPGIVLLLIMARLGSAFAHLMLCLRTFPILKRGFFFDLKLLRPLVSYGGWITISNVIGPVLAYFDRFIIGSLITMAAVAYYTAPYEIALRLWIIPASLVMTLFPAFSTLGATRKEDLRLFYVRALKYLLLGLGPIVLVLVVFAGEILRLWLGSDFAKQSTVVFQILAISALVGCMAPVSGGLIQGLGRPDIVSKVYLLYLLPNAGIVWILVQNMGIKGAALSFAFRALIETVVLFILSSRLIGLPYNSFIENGVWRSVTVLSGLGALLWAASHISVILIQISFIAIVVLFFIIITWRYVIDEIDKKVIISVTDWMGWIKDR